jgi:Ser/Thr protein kinase RdoA (MazF antagonist)
VQEVRDRVLAEYGLRLVTLDAVAGGADAAATLWRGTAADGRSYAVKVSRGGLAVGLAVTAHLAGRGVPGAPAPLATVDGRLWTGLAGAQLSVVPWLSGRVAAAGGLDAAQWRSFGALLAGVHAVPVPAELPELLPTEDYQPLAAAAVRALGDRMSGDPAGDPASDAAGDPAGDEVAGELVAAWRSAAGRIAALPEAAERLGAELRRRPAPRVLCHGDAHLANLLVADSGELWLVDWDGAVLAPRERDLMFVVEGVLADAPVQPEEQAHFFAGYGRPEVDPAHLAYYRCAWALEDVAGFAVEILDDPTRTGAQRAQALRYFRSLLTPTGIVSVAERSLRDLDR